MLENINNISKQLNSIIKEYNTMSDLTRLRHILRLEYIYNNIQCDFLSDKYQNNFKQISNKFNDLKNNFNIENLNILKENLINISNIIFEIKYNKL